VLSAVARHTAGWELKAERLNMRAEIVAVVDEIRSSLALLRRHL
jgi:hypothetical protein